MRPLPPLADRLREEASSLLLDDGYNNAEVARYLDTHNLHDSGKVHNAAAVGLHSGLLRPEEGVAETANGEDIGSLRNGRLDNDTNLQDPASLMSDTPTSDDVEPRHDSQDSSAQGHGYLNFIQDDHDLDMDDTDGGAPLHNMTTVAEAVTAMLSSDLDTVTPSFDADDSDSAMDAFDIYPDNLSFETQSSQMDSEVPQDAVDSTAENSEASDTPDLGPVDVPMQTPADPLAQNPAFMPPIMDTVFGNMPDVLLSAANPFVLGSENLGLVDFLRDWARLGLQGSAVRTHPPDVRSVIRQAENPPAEITYADLRGDECDVQGLNWTAMETSRQEARVRRRMTYRNHVNCPGSDKRSLHEDNEYISSRESFFRFRKMNIRQDVSLGHFQLRSVLACPSAAKAYYPSPKGVMCINSAARKTELALNMRRFPGLASAITTLDANHGVLLAGTFTGDYMLQSLHAENNKTFSDGQVGGLNGITNHVKIDLGRTGSGPVASIANNDCNFRVLDITTQQFIFSTMYPFAPNCSVLSPDRRLRVIVGDYCNVLITDAESGQVFQQLTGHCDYGFACDWSDDGWTVATAFQDKGIKIWDARRWCDSRGVSTPICTVRADLAGVRNLRFSPVGSGRNVLVAAEEADFVNIIDAQSYHTKQTVDIFGEIGGISFANDGQDLNILCADSHRGGLLQLERCGRGPEPLFENNWSRHPSSAPSQMSSRNPSYISTILEGLQPF